MADDSHPNRQTSIDDHDLDLTLGLGLGLHFSISSDARNPKREQQAIRREEGRVKRGMKKKKRKQQNDVVSAEEGGNCGKVVKLGFRWLGIGNVGGFRPYQGDYYGENRGSGSVSVSTSSSAVSDNCCYSNSAAGGNSSDSSSHSSHSHIHLPDATTKQATSSQEQHTLVNSNQCTKSHVPNPNPNPNPNLNPSSKEVQVPIGKPLKPNGQIPSQESGSLLAQMPCVTTTGNGPKGKTITGFLYKYTKTEVCIVCSCHGASFSPTGFIQHAGGVDVEHPLKHIRVSPFPLR